VRPGWTNGSRDAPGEKNSPGRKPASCLCLGGLGVVRLSRGGAITGVPCSLMTHSVRSSTIIVRTRLCGSRCAWRSPRIHPTTRVRHEAVQREVQTDGNTFRVSARGRNLSIRITGFPRLRAKPSGFHSMGGYKTRESISRGIDEYARVFRNYEADTRNIAAIRLTRA